MYRHPQNNFDNFTDYFYAVVDKISKEFKISILVEGINLDLLNFEIHECTDQFVTLFGTYCFQSHIIEPTRITNHSATLIDHVYSNFLEHDTVSKNLTVGYI